MVWVTSVSLAVVSSAMATVFDDPYAAIFVLHRTTTMVDPNDLVTVHLADRKPDLTRS